MLNLVRLQVLAAVARHGSVTDAARDLNYVQSSVSHHLSRLETEVGLQLIEPLGRGIRLTAAGGLLAQRAAEILGRVRSAQDELEAMAGLRIGRVRVAGFQSALSTLVADAAAELNASAPGIELILADIHPAIALQQLREGLVDVAVVFRYDDEVPEDMHFEHLFDDPMMLISRQAGQTFDDHRESPWIAGCERCDAAPRSSRDRAEAFGGGVCSPALLSRGALGIRRPLAWIRAMPYGARDGRNLDR